MHKQVIKADVPETGGPFNLCIRFGNQIYISGLPPFDADYAAKLRDARAKGLQVIDEHPRPGARGSKIAFLHPKSTGGILIHFVERVNE